VKTLVIQVELTDDEAVAVGIALEGRRREQLEWAAAARDPDGLYARDCRAAAERATSAAGHWHRAVATASAGIREYGS